MEKTTKLLSIILALIMCFGVLSIATFAEAPIASGGFGEYGSGSWVLAADGNLTISGEVGLDGRFDGAPWYSYKNYVKTVTFASGANAKEGASLAYMFWECYGLTSADVSKFDTSSATDMGLMFGSCTHLTTVNLLNLDTSSVKNMSSMFYFCVSLTVIDLSSFDTSSATDLSSMFSFCHALTALDLTNFDTSSVKDMSYMFYKCSSLTSLDLSSFDTSSVTDMTDMFKECGVATDGVPAKGLARNAEEAAKFNDSTETNIDASNLVFESFFVDFEITSAPSNTELQYKSTASTDGLKVTAKYSDGTTKDVTDQVNVSNFSANNKRGDYTATVEFEGQTATFNYSVSYAWWQWIIRIVLFGWLWY